MSTAIQAPPKASAVEQPRPARPAHDGGDRFLLTGMSWEFYEHLLAELGDRPIRVTYDRGDLELMSPSYGHDGSGRVLGWLIDIVADEFNVPIKGGRSTTLRRKDVARGIEADDCFWIAHVSDILGNTEIDLTRDPPPDLAIEVDVTNSSLDRLGIHAALRIPEVWRYDGTAIRVYRLNDNGEYDELDYSPTFPYLPLDGLLVFLERSVEVDDLTLRREFREWLRTEVLPKWKQAQ